MAKPKLDNDQRMFVLRMHSEGYSSGKIVEEINLKWGITMRADAIAQTCHAKKWEPYVKSFREEYLAKVKSVPIANKRVRIDDLETERIRLKGLIDKNPRKTKADINQYLQLVAELRRISEVAREEMEKKPHLFQNVVIGMGDMSDEALHRRKQELADKFRRNIGDRITGVEPDSGGIDSEG